mgnify:CR=1 FL=1
MKDWLGYLRAFYIQTDMYWISIEKLEKKYLNQPQNFSLYAANAFFFVFPMPSMLNLEKRRAGKVSDDDDDDDET